MDGESNMFHSTRQVKVAASSAYWKNLQIKQVNELAQCVS